MTEGGLHSLLRRQISKYRAMEGEVSPPLEAFIKAVDKAYKEFDRERSLVQRSMDLSSKELMHKNESLQKQTEKMLYLSSELDDFAFALAHDLREPLRSIVSYTQLLQSKLEGKLTSEELDFLKYVVSNAKKMDVMLTGMTRYADIHINFNPQPLNIKDVLDVVKHQLAEKIKVIGATIVVSSMPVVNASRGQMVILFRNLILNSLNNHSDSPLLIEISCIEKKDYFQFTVKDNGIGMKDIDPNKYLKLFKKINHLSIDSGIGLAVCNKIVINHGGKMNISNISTSGLQVSFTLSS
jgi:light-regulated signal transduction histidine kinase (bacteriophytochrome)